MSKRKRKFDNRQLSLFDYDIKIDEYVKLKEEILNSPDKQIQDEAQSWEEHCIEIAAGIKRGIKQSGIPRKAIPDLVNNYFGWPDSEEYKKLTTAEKKGVKHLSIEMFNHYLSKPSDYPIPSYYIYAIQHVTRSLEPCRSFADAEDARVISSDEVRQMRIGKLDETIIEMQRLKKELRVKR